MITSGPSAPLLPLDLYKRPEPTSKLVLPKVTVINKKSKWLLNIKSRKATTYTYLLNHPFTQDAGGHDIIYDMYRRLKVQYIIVSRYIGGSDSKNQKCNLNVPNVF